MRQDQGVAETSTVDGQVQDPGSQVWKLTSLSAEAARAKYGSNRVCVKSGGLRSGGDAVEVLVSLGGVSEDQATAKMGLMSAMGSNDANPADQRRAMAQQAVERVATKR